MKNNNSEIIFVTSFPKSGATWFQFLIYSVKFGEVRRSIDVMRSYPEIVHTHLINELLSGKKQFFVKNHFSLSEYLPYRTKIKHCVYLVRNPLDAIVSRINHYLYEGSTDLASNLQKRDAIIAQLISEANKKATEKDKVGGWNTHVYSWLVENNNLETHLVRYEDLLADSTRELLILNKNLELDLSKQNIEKGCKLATFTKMKELEAYELENRIAGMFYSPQRRQSFLKMGIQFINQGQSGSYKSVLDASMLTKAEEAFESGMRLTGYI